MAKKAAIKKKRKTPQKRPACQPASMGDSPVTRVPIKKINRAAYNPRKDLRPGDPEYEKLKRSFAEFGFVGGMVWNKRTGHLVGGHQRLSVLVNEYAVTHVDVVVVDLPLAKEKALNIALNKVAGSWDDDRLLSLLVDLKNDETVDETLSGFDLAEMQTLMDMQAGEAEKGEADEMYRAGDNHEVVVVCADDKQQQQVFERLTGEGFTCRVLTY